ncbi:MAG: prolyl-tRNA synthetase associated domain-containing protein [Tyzzerella sp.]|uniref:Prolyl-tRNA synthetase associated domain-containing protein n=1 Tax=Candidatus Fimicola merdigallinarum TaxID=2840819 RepID=A0A9D9DWC7_9FIRM|nr:prolyl-tRNA synthetase associated domain-containing protein [Candidatus Fimicola merdigallinarum]
MDRLEIYEYLKKLNIWYEITEHDAVYNMLQITNIELPYPEAEGKNLFVRDDKKQNYYLITVKGNKKVNLKEFRKNNNTRPLSFASEDDMMSIIGLPSGSVTPLGVLNDKENRVKVFIDEEFITSSGLIGVHPNDNRATVWLKVEDLIDIIKKNGNTVNIVKI